MSAQATRPQRVDKMDACIVHPTSLNAREGASFPRLVQCGGGTEHASHARAFWIAQARHHLRRARAWKKMFGGEDHRAAEHWFKDEMLRVARLRRWAHEFGRMR